LYLAKVMKGMSMTKNNEILKRMTLGTEYLKRLDKSGYTLVDMNMIEPFSLDDKNHHPTSIVFERDSTIYAIRSDWTRTLLNFNNNYLSVDRQVGYVGRVVREETSVDQAGAEIYQANEADMIESIISHMNFVHQNANKRINAFVINNDQLIDLFVDQ